MRHNQDFSISEYQNHPLSDDLTPLCSLTQLCEELKISKSTAKNWLKLRKIEAQEMKGTKAFFSRAYVDELKSDLKHGRKDMLKSRRNKKFLFGKSFYKSYADISSENVDKMESLISYICEKRMNVDFEMMSYLICECFISLVCSKNGISLSKEKSFLKAFLEGEVQIGEGGFFIEEFLQERKRILDFIEHNPELFKISYRYVEDEDTIGLLYISIRDMNARKVQGVYYTPPDIVKKAVDYILSDKNSQGAKILDPCCGTGNFLIKLSRKADLESIFGFDIDELSVAITRMNLGLRYGFSYYKSICSHIVKQDFLKWDALEKFDFILGNPPWGYHFSSEYLDEIAGKYQILRHKGREGMVESFSLFVEKSISVLKEKGVLSFVLPEAILNVGAHLFIRKYIFKHTHLQYVEFIGECFHHVQCPSIILQLGKIATDENRDFYLNAHVKTLENSFCIRQKRDFEHLCDEFHLRPHISDFEYEILRKLYRERKNFFLGRDSIFALGIVTGNNAGYISKEGGEGKEVILRGRNIAKYFVVEPFFFIDEQCGNEYKNFQQVAKIGYYRSKPKLLYPFISSKLRFAYDEDGRLSLNSCNILIPNSDVMNIKYLLGILNSRIAQFIYSEMFRSVKILKSHICQIPIPQVQKCFQNEIIEYVDEILRLNMENDEVKYRELYEELDEKISYLYGLSAEEYEYIRLFTDK